MKKFGLIAASLALPVFAGAQAVNTSYIDSILISIQRILNLALPIIIAAAVVYFIYGIARYVMSGSDDAKAAAKDKIIYGIVGLFVMISVWGLVNILVRTFNLNNTPDIRNPLNQIPDLPR